MNKYLNLIIFIAVVTVNALANALPINGQTTGDVSAAYDNYFTPAGFTFSIWSLIYLSLLVCMIYQLKDRKSSTGESLSKQTGYILIMNFMANIGWIYAWHYALFGGTLLFMTIILITLIVLNMRVDRFSLIVRFSMRLYLGWICVATIANIAVVLTWLNWNGGALGGEKWGMILIVIAGILAVMLSIRKNYLIAAITIAWGLFGIYMKQQESLEWLSYKAICLVVILMIMIVSVWMALRKQFRKNKISEAEPAA
ncbi:MAG: tryptophan-rich sensory protein [Cyclobacteriaceae bacterium]